MNKVSSKQQKIISIMLSGKEMSSSEVYRNLLQIKETISLVTVKRSLSELTKSKRIESFGLGRSVKYRISELGRIFSHIDVKNYVSIEPDKRFGLRNYNFKLLKNLPVDIFEEDEKKGLEASTENYNKRIKNLPLAIQKKELERLVIELSWKSSKIEGNTYTLLDTERLILDNKEATGRSREETQMILNHKEAFDYVRQYSSQFQTMTRKNLEELHSVLVKNLNVGRGLRTRPVGITGSVYRPLDNVYQITEAVDELIKQIKKNRNPYAKALIALLGISYIQPFEDGNKRTARLMANALLISNSLSPLSYRSVDEEEYRSSMLVFYELNSLIQIKKIFIEQYEFAAENYTAKM